MKKIFLVTLAAALVVILTGCASGGGQGTNQAETNQPQRDISSQLWFVSSSEGGNAARENTVNLLPRPENYIYIYFKEGTPGADFETIIIDFVVEKEVEVAWQAAYQPGAVWGGTQVIGIMDKGPIETDCSMFIEPWYRYDETLEALEKENMTGIVLRIGSDGERARFTVTDVRFTGLER